MPALEDLPPLTTVRTIALIGLVLVFWLGLRVNILRRLQERSGPDAAIPAAAWLRRLAEWPGTYAALALLAAAFALLCFM